MMLEIMMEIAIIAFKVFVMLILMSFIAYASVPDRDLPKKLPQKKYYKFVTDDSEYFTHKLIDAVHQKQIEGSGITDDDVLRFVYMFSNMGVSVAFVEAKFEELARKTRVDVETIAKNWNGSTEKESIADMDDNDILAWWDQCAEYLDED